MINFLLDLISNLVILAALLAACCAINWMRPDDAKVNGYRVFVVFVAIALIFDAALTFLVFADSQARYGKFSTTDAFVPRMAAYLSASGIAVLLSRMRSRKEAGRAEARAVIRASGTSASVN